MISSMQVESLLREELRTLRHIHESDRHEIANLKRWNQQLNADLKIACELFRENVTKSLEVER
jgi:hypothetical protein